MKLHTYKGEEVEEISFESSKAEVLSAIREFFQPIAFVTGAVIAGGEHLIDLLRGRAAEREHVKKNDSAPA